MAMKRFHVVFDCATERCPGDAIESEHESLDEAKARVEFIREEEELVWAMCPRCGKARQYDPGMKAASHPYVVDTASRQQRSGGVLGLLKYN